MWAIEGGQPFRAGYPEVFLQQIRERQLFDNLGQTTAELRVNDKTLIVVVVLTFKGDPAVRKGAPGAERRRRDRP